MQIYTNSRYFYPMDVNEKRKADLRATKQQSIIDTTAKLIVERGIANLSMEDIAEAASYTKRTLYVYFQSKDEILLSIYIDDLKKRRTFLAEKISKAETGIDKLTEWAYGLFQYCEKNKHSLQVQNYIETQFVDLDRVDEAVFAEFQAVNKQLIISVRAIFDLGIFDQSFRTGIQADMTASQFIHSYQAILSRAFSDTYSYVKFMKTGYIHHYVTMFTQSIILKQSA